MTFSDNILNIGACAAQDDSIIKKEVYTYTPYTSSLGESEEIRITIQHQDACLLPCESYLYLQMKVETENFSESTPDADKVHFVRNFPSFLFSDARYELNGVEIDRIKNVGITSTMKLITASRESNLLGYYGFTESFKKKEAPNKIKDIVYDVMLPLSVWFGFCEDYRKIIWNSRHELIMNRASTYLNCIHGGKDEASAPSVKITLNKIEWKMPHIILNNSMKINMNRFLSNNKQLPLQYRSWEMHEYPELPQTTNQVWSVKTISHLNKPRYVLVAFQTDKKDKKIEDASKFLAADIVSVRLHLNSNVYPYHMHEVNIPHGRFTELYEAYKNIQSSYYDGAEVRNIFSNTHGDFQSDTIFAFDTSRADDSLMKGAVDIRLEIKASKNIDKKTSAFCLIIYENEFTYSPNNAIVTRSV